MLSQTWTFLLNSTEFYSILQMTLLWYHLRLSQWCCSVSKYLVAHRLTCCPAASKQFLKAYVDTPGVCVCGGGVYTLISAVDIMQSSNSALALISSSICIIQLGSHGNIWYFWNISQVLYAVFSLRIDSLRISGLNLSKVFVNLWLFELNQNIDHILSFLHIGTSKLICDT